MVERVVNMRKLAPAKPDSHLSNKDASKKSSYSQESSGFGTSFSKKALDMALRHMVNTHNLLMFSMLLNFINVANIDIKIQSKMI